MREFEVKFFITPPVEATDSEVQEWIEYSLGDRGSIEMDNPLCDHELSIWENGKFLSIN